MVIQSQPILNLAICSSQSTQGEWSKPLLKREGIWTMCEILDCGNITHPYSNYTVYSYSPTSFQYNKASIPILQQVNNNRSDPLHTLSQFGTNRNSMQLFPPSILLATRMNSFSFSHPLHISLQSRKILSRLWHIGLCGNNQPRLLAMTFYPKSILRRNSNGKP
jgi:hypothetical protein